jgi:hypothetical protein
MIFRTIKDKDTKNLAKERTYGTALKKIGHLPVSAMQSFVAQGWGFVQYSVILLHLSEIIRSFVFSHAP